MDVVDQCSRQSPKGERQLNPIEPGEGSAASLGGWVQDKKEPLKCLDEGMTK